MSKIISLDKSANGPKSVNVVIPYYEKFPEACIVANEAILRYGIPGYVVMVSKRETAILTFARNEAVYGGLQIVPDFVFFLDTDVGDYPEQMGQMVEAEFNGQKIELPWIVARMKTILDHNLNICGGIYVQRQAPHKPIAYKKWPEDSGKIGYANILEFPDEGVLEVDAIGTGFLCIKTAVIEDINRGCRESFARKNQALDIIEKAIEKMEPGSGQNALKSALEVVKEMRPSGLPAFWLDFNLKDNRWEPFDFIGEDVSFCNEAKKLGYKIYCDFGVQLGHESRKYMTPEMYKHAYKERVMAQAVAELGEEKIQFLKVG